MKILHLDSTHSYLYDKLEELGHTNHFDFDLWNDSLLR